MSTRHLLHLVAAVAPLLATPAHAESPAVYRCGSSYGTTPCAGGQQVAVDDARSDEQRRQAQAVRQQDAALARALAAERREREHDQAASARLAAAGIGPTQAERRRAELEAAQAAKHKPTTEPRRHARRAKPPVAPVAPVAPLAINRR